MTQQLQTSLIQHTFITWFKDSSQLFATPLTIAKQTKQSIELAFTNANSMISATLTSREISVQFNWNGVFWDYLIYFEAMPELYRGYYVDSLRHADDDTFYVSRELLWETLLFGPFLAWVNITLITAPWVEVYVQHETHNVAKLLNSLPSNYNLKTSSSGNCIIPNPVYKEVLVYYH